MPDADAVTCLNFVETGPSVLREMPWIMVKDHKVSMNMYIYMYMS